MHIAIAVPIREAVGVKALSRIWQPSQYFILFMKKVNECTFSIYVDFKCLYLNTYILVSRGSFCLVIQ